MDFATRKAELITHLNSETQLLLRYLTPHPDPQPGAFILADGDAFLHLLESHRLTTVFYQHVNLENSVLATIRDRLHKVSELSGFSRSCQIRVATELSEK